MGSTPISGTRIFCIGYNETYERNIMSKNYESTSDSQTTAQPSAVSFANVVSDIFSACFAEYKDQKKQAWIKEQKAAGNQIVENEDGQLIAVQIIDTYK